MNKDIDKGTKRDKEIDISHDIKVKAFVRRWRNQVSASVVCSMMLCMMSVGAFATGEPAVSFDLAATMTTSVQKIVNDLLAMIAAVLPITVTLMGAAIGVTYGIRFIKSIVKKAG